MTWWAVHVTPEAVHRPDLATWLVQHTGHAVEERHDGTLVASLPEKAAADELKDRLASEKHLAASVHEVPHVDWTQRWRDGISAHEFERVRLTPSWLAHEPSPLPTVVIDPESAFGTGEHGSTRSAIRMLERHIRPGDTMLDLGSGSGVIAIIAARLGAEWAVGIECDAECLPIAASNAHKNRVADKVTWIEADAAAITPLFAPVRIIVSNILRIVNVALLPEIRESLAADGVAIFAGMEVDERPLFLGALESEGFAMIDEVTDHGWWSVAASVTR